MHRSHSWIRLFLVLLLVNAASISAQSGNSDYSGTTAELDFTPAIPDRGNSESLIVITGSISGETISDLWDFTPVSGAEPTTHGLMSSQISSTVGRSASLYFDNDYTRPGGIRPQGNNEWYYRFTLGNAREDFLYYNAKETFPIPPGPYSMITVRKGPSGREFRHREYSLDNFMTGTVTRWEYSPEEKTLRLTGSLQSEWNDGEDWIRFDFDVLMGGQDDRNSRFNQATLGFIH